MFRHIAVLALAATLALAGAAVAQKKYDPGASDTEIKIGQTMPYSGGASAYGTIGRAEQAYFKMINEQGGVNGRKINLISLDDGFSPPKTLEQVRRLIEQEQVLFLFNNVGTAPNVAIHKYVNARKVPHVFVGSGSAQWDNPKEFPWTMGWWPSYRIEGAIFARYVLENVPDPKIAITGQNDDAGRDFHAGFVEGLGDRAPSIIVAEATYEATDSTVDSQVIALAGSGANVFFNGGTSKFVAQAIRKAYDIGWKPVELIPSVASSVDAVLKPAGFEKATGLITAQFFKDPTDASWANDPEVAEWRAFMDKYYPEGSRADSSNVYAYAVAASLVQVLKQAGDDLTRANIMRHASTMKDVKIPLLLPGIRLNTSPSDFSPIKQMRLAKFNGEGWELFGSLLSKPD
jgi:branched-chain amino acid transport system substrate-binding protein